MNMHAPALVIVLGALCICKGLVDGSCQREAQAGDPGGGSCRGTGEALADCCHVDFREIHGARLQKQVVAVLKRKGGWGIWGFGAGRVGAVLLGEVVDGSWGGPGA